MKRLGILFMSLLLSPLFLAARIDEVQSFQELLKHIDQEDVIIFCDLDNTIIETVSLIGSDQWFVHYLQELKKQGYSTEVALNDYLVPLYTHIRNTVDVQLVEEITTHVIRHIQERGIRVIGLTTQGTGLKDRTHHQLKSFDINFTLNNPVGEFQLKDAPECFYKDGIIFTNGSDKGHAVLAFFEQTNSHAKTVIVIDDKHHHLAHVEQVLETHGTDSGRTYVFIGMRYARLDEKIASFDPEQARQELLTFQAQ